MRLGSGPRISGTLLPQPVLRMAGAQDGRRVSRVCRREGPRRSPGGGAQGPSLPEPGEPGAPAPLHQGTALFSGSVVSDSVRLRGLKPARLLCPWASPGENTAAGCCVLLQEISPTQGSSLCLLHCRRILNH